MTTVTSRDGTPIAYTREGSGLPVILVVGGLIDRSENAPLVTELARRFTAYNYDRRGRGESGDTLPYALEREIEDIEALIREAGGAAFLYGVSSGGALALEAAAGGLPIEKLGVYEVPCGATGPGSSRRRAYARSLVITGGASGTTGLPPDFYDRPAEALAAAIPGAERLAMKGQGHVADPTAVARVLERFF
jgi:alpha-beta hydrolase superfamily lysophospholipase